MPAPEHPGQAYGTMPERRGYADKQTTTAMEPSSSSTASPWMSRSEYVSTLPPWRRLLAILNWRPVYEIEQETKMIEADIEKLDRLISKLDALSRRSDFNSQTQSSTDSN
jgi:hypothetical protein